MKRKILFISPLPPPNYGSAMSSEMCLKILKESKEFEVKSIKINFAENMKDVGKINLSKIKESFSKRKEIKNTLKSFNPDLVYIMPATSKIGLYKDFLLISQVKSNKLLYHIRTHISKKDKNNFFKKRIYNSLFNKGKVILLDKSFEKDIEDFVNKKDIYVLPNAIKNEISDKELNEVIKKRSKNNKFNILFLSNMHEEKGWFILLKTCKLLKDAEIPFNCWFIGEWPTKREKDKFFNFVSKENLKEEVVYLGKKTGREKNEFLKETNVFIFPTYYPLEAHPRVVLEAMMFGLPVIANNHASISNTIQNGRTGYLLEKNSPEEIFKYVKFLINNKTKRLDMGLKGRERFLKEFEVNSYKNKFIKIIKEALKD
ncbi:MAG: glycosyltransferase [Candidatus Pacearchaeota archaeon]